MGNPRFAIDSAITLLTGEAPVRSTGYEKVQCPFHDDSNASASIDWDRERFKCFACGVAGDAIGLIMTVREVSYRTAVQIAEEEVEPSGQPVSRATSKRRKRRRTSLF